MNLPVLSNSSTCDAVAPYAGPFALLERVKIATSPFELTATPDTSPTFISAGSLRKLTLPSNGISAACCANAGAAPSTATSATMTRVMLPPVDLLTRSGRSRRGRLELQLLHAPVEELRDVDLVLARARDLVNPAELLQLMP